MKKPTLSSAILLVILVSFGPWAEAKPVKSKPTSSTQGGGTEIHGSDPDAEPQGEPANTLPAEFDFGDIPLSKRQEAEQQLEEIEEEDGDVEETQIYAPEDPEDEEKEQPNPEDAGEESAEVIENAPETDPNPEEDQTVPDNEDEGEVDPEDVWIDADSDTDVA